MAHPEYPDVKVKGPHHVRQEKEGNNLKETETIQTINNIEVRQHCNQERKTGCSSRKIEKELLEI